MGDRRDGELLHHRGGTHQGSRGDEEDVAQPPGAHLAQDMPAKHRRAAAAAGASGVDVLTLGIDHDAAVPVPRSDIDALLEHEIVQQTRSDPPQIAGEYSVIVISVGVCRAKVSPYGVRRSRC